MIIPTPDIDQLRQQISGLITLSYVATGGFKVVFRGVYDSGRVEAIKAIYIPSEADGFAPEQSAQLVARAQREIVVLRSCQPLCIVKLGSVEPRPITIGAHTYLVYSEEFLPGQPMSGLINQQQPPDFGMLKSVFSFLIDVIREMVRLEYLHRDIKPGNIMVTGLPDRPYVILDLGIAYKVQGTELTQGMTPPGTRSYMAPELFMPNYKDVMDFRCDLYSAGLTVYVLASGIHPFAPKPEDEVATVVRVVTQRPPPLETLRPDLPVVFCRIIDRCIKKNLALRYARIDLLHQELQEVQK